MKISEKRKNSHGIPIKIPDPQPVEIHPDVKLVLEFMQANFEASKLLDIAKAVYELAVPFFGRCKTEPNIHTILRERFIPIVLGPPPWNEDN